MKRVEENNSVEATHLGVESAIFILAKTQRDERERLELQDKYEKFLAAHNKEVQKRIELENKVMR